GNDGNQFAWTFNGLGGRSWELAKFAPAGFSDKQYRVYVSLNPLYRK
ncbi:CzcE family metal-binding protein, partial [Sediminibacterium sp.]